MTLVTACRCALADLVGLYYEGVLSEAAKQTIIDLHTALNIAGENVHDYDECVEEIVFRNSVIRTYAKGNPEEG